MINENIIFNGIDEKVWCEVRYLRKVSELLLEKMSDISIVITTYLTRDLPKTKYKKVVIVTGDEQGALGLNAFRNSDVLAVFRIFNTNNRYDDDFIYPIPPGYNWTMHNDQSIIMDKMYPDKQIEQREYDIFYSGQLIPNRLKLVDKLNYLSDKFKIVSNSTKSFRTGLDIDDYYKMLGNSKISVCPDGTAIDTFRYVESFGSGNIVITTNKDKSLWYYEKSPAIFLNSWDELTEELVYDLLHNEKLREEGLRYYQNYLSEDAVSSYIYNKIKN